MESSPKKVCTDVDKPKLSLEDFKFGRFLAEGGSGRVYTAKKVTGDDRGTICALKIIKKTKIVDRPDKVEFIKSERCVMEIIEHPFIVKLLYAFETTIHFCLGLEYMCNGDFFEYLNSVGYIPEVTARLYAAEVILALKYLHDHDIIYRDLKPDNMLIDAEGHIKLTDFGLCKRLCPGTNQAYSFCGTTDYMSPEMIDHNVYTKSIDWWSVGVFVYDMLFGFPPFTVAGDRTATINKIKCGKIVFDLKRYKVSKKATDLIQKLLTLDPDKRLGSGSTGAKELMGHPFFKTINFDWVLNRRYKPKVKWNHITIHPDNTYAKSLVIKSDDYSRLKKNDYSIFTDFEYVSPDLLA